jgi:hypothetical protein
MLSLICNVSYYTDPRIGARPKLLTFSPNPSSVPAIARLRFIDPLHLASTAHGGVSSSPATKSSSSNIDKEPSPYPNIDVAMKAALKSWPGTPNGILRSWQLYEESNTILYVVQGNRYCENVGREHKSNNIFFVVDLAANLYHQKWCHIYFTS